MKGPKSNDVNVRSLTTGDMKAQFWEQTECCWHCYYTTHLRLVSCVDKPSVNNKWCYVSYLANVNQSPCAMFFFSSYMRCMPAFTSALPEKKILLYTGAYLCHHDVAPDKRRKIKRNGSVAC